MYVIIILLMYVKILLMCVLLLLMCNNININNDM